MKSLRVAIIFFVLGLFLVLVLPKGTTAQTGGKITAYLFYDLNGNGIYEPTSDEDLEKVVGEVFLYELGIRSSTGECLPDPDRDRLIQSYRPNIYTGRVEIFLPEPTMSGKFVLRPYVQGAGKTKWNLDNSPSKVYDYWFERTHTQQCCLGSSCHTPFTPGSSYVVYLGASIDGSGGPPTCDASFPNEKFRTCVYDGINFDTYVGGFDENNLRHDWGFGCPSILGVNCDTFSIIWRGNFAFSPAYYKFHTRSDDGVRLSVGNRKRIDNWTVHGSTDDYSPWIFLSGTEVMLEYFEKTDRAVAILDWRRNDYPTSPTLLLTNNQTNPLDLSGVPFFSAVYNDPDSSDIANAYQLQLREADSPGDFSTTVWDSGVLSMANCNQGSRCQTITYGGSPLAVDKRYAWRIRYRDDDNFLGSWSQEVAFFELTDSGTLTGYVWDDRDGNCFRDAGEENYYNPVNPVILELQQTGIGVVDSFSTNNIPSPGNNFTLDGLAAGSYELILTSPRGWRATTQTSIGVTINPGEITTAMPQCR